MYICTSAHCEKYASMDREIMWTYSAAQNCAQLYSSYESATPLHGHTLTTIVYNFVLHSTLVEPYLQISHPSPNHAPETERIVGEKKAISRVPQGAMAAAFFFFENVCDAVACVAQLRWFQFQTHSPPIVCISVELTQTLEPLCIRSNNRAIRTNCACRPYKTKSWRFEYFNKHSCGMLHEV